MENKTVRKIPFSQYLFFIIKLVVAGGTLYFVLTLVHLEQLTSLFRTAKYSYIIAGILLLPLNIGVRIVKWKILVSSLNGDVKWKSVAGSILVGITFGSFTPGEVGDFVGRMFHLPETRKSHVVGLALVDRFQTMLAMALIGLPSFFFLLIDSPLLRCLLISITTLTIIGANFFLGKQFISFAQRFQHIPYIGPIAAAMFQLKKNQQVHTFVLSVFLIIVIGIQMSLFLNAFHPVGYGEGILGTGLMLFAKSFVPLSIGDLGIRELATAYIFSQWNIPMSVSVNASLLLFSTNVFLPALVGIIVFLFSKQQR